MPASAESLRAALARLGGLPAPADGIGARAASLEAAARRFFVPADPLRREALARLTETTGCSRPMAEAALERAFGPIQEPEILAVAGDAPGAVHRLVGIVAAGNVPGVALPKTVLALAAGSAVLVKAASAEPWLAWLYARSLAETDAALGRRLEVLAWRGGTAALDRELASSVDSLVVYGSDETVEALRPSTSGAFVPHGAKLSVAVVRLDGALDLGAAARAAALDVSLYEQLGCLSPQTIYLAGGDEVLRLRFLEALAEALDEAARALPPAARDEAAALAVRRARDHWEWRELAGEPVRVRASGERLDWTVILAPEPALGASPLYRTVFLRPLASAGDLGEALGSSLSKIESVGIAPADDPALRAAVARLGIPRCAPLGGMQAPGLEWRQGGRPPLEGIVAPPGARKAIA